MYVKQGSTVEWLLWLQTNCKAVIYLVVAISYYMYGFLLSLQMYGCKTGGKVPPLAKDILLPSLGTRLAEGFAGQLIDLHVGIAILCIVTE